MAYVIVTLSLSIIALEKKCIPTSLALVQISFPGWYHYKLDLTTRAQSLNNKPT